MYAHTNYLSLDIHRETDLFLVVLAFINIFYLSSVIHPDGEGTLLLELVVQAGQPSKAQ